MCTVNVIADFSGSMAELGKRKILLNLIKALRYLQPSIKIFAWHEGTITRHDSFQDITPSDASNVPALHGFMTSSESNRFLLLSDGNFEPLTNTDGLIIKSVAIGPDASSETLSKSGTVFQPEDITTALHSVMYDDE